MPLSLFDPEIYLEQIERLKAKSKRRGIKTQAAGAPSLWAIRGREKELCRRLAEDVGRGRYTLGPLTRVTVWADDKQRVIHRPELLDAIVLGAIAQRLTVLLEHVLDDHVHAYRPGRNQQKVLAQLCGYLARHRASRPQVKARGAFVVQRDLAAYGESIPTHSRSRLWSQLDALLAELNEPERRVLRGLLDSACRPTVKLLTGEVVTLEHGLPTGSPIQQPLANLYLSPLDAALKTIAPEFYARFGDDVLLMDSDVQRAVAAVQTMELVTRELELNWNQDKSHNWYFTTPGRPFAGRCETQFRPTSHIEYLGARLTFEGRLGLKRKRLRQLLQRSQRRINNTVALAPKEQALVAVAESLGNSLHGNDRLTDVSCEAIRTWVDDRAQLKQLDRLLAQRCAEALSGRKGIKAFRVVTPAALRRAGLHSLLQLRRRSTEQK